jgi:hypothetical protein
MRTLFSVPYKLSIERQQEKNTGQIWKNEEKMSCQAEESMEAYRFGDSTEELEAFSALQIQQKEVIIVGNRENGYFANGTGELRMENT